jgi:hypothetical protein
MRRRLHIVLPSDQLTGEAPPAFERACRSCSIGDDTHRGLLHLTSHIAQRTLAICVPPTARAPVRDALGHVEQWLAGQGSEAAIRKGRSDLYAATAFVEQKTLDAVGAALASAEVTRHTAIDAHADGVILRYVGLGAYYAASVAVLVMDGVSEPSALAGTLRQAAGAVAYQSAGLGPARSQEVRSRACQQADWEHERPGAPRGHVREALAIQLLHEYLGAYWKDQSDAHRVLLGELVHWALPASLQPS